MGNMAPQVQKNIFYRIHIDPFLLIGIFALMGLSLTVLYSVGGYDMVVRQLIRLLSY